MTSSTTPVGPPPLPTMPTPAFAGVLRQVSVGALVSRSLAAWWRNILRFGALTLLVFVPVILLGVAAAAGAALGRRGAAGVPFTGKLAGAELMILAAFPIMLVVSAVQMVAVTYGAVQHMAGRPVRFGAMLAAGFRRLLPVVAACFVAGVMVFAGFLLLVVPGIVVACAVTVAVPAVVIERIGPVDAIRRSWGLTRGHRVTLFGAWFVMAAVSFGLNLALQLGTVLFGAMHPMAAIIVLPLYLLVAALPTVLPAVAYHELRVAKEGIATEELAKVFE